MTESAPVAWLEIKGVRYPVSVAFSISAENNEADMFSFDLGQYNTDYAVWIDPVLQWRLKLPLSGGVSSSLNVKSMTMDGSGSIYVAGIANATWGNPLNAYDEWEDGVLLKLNNNGALQWNTVIPSQIYGMHLTSENKIYVALNGDGDNTWGTPLNPHTASNSGDLHAAEFSTSGALLWHTYSGDASHEFGAKIVANSAGDVFIAGDSSVEVSLFNYENSVVVDKLSKNDCTFFVFKASNGRVIPSCL